MKHLKKRKKRVNKRPSIWNEELRRATGPKRLSLLLLLSAIILFTGYNALNRRVPFDRSFIDNWYGVFSDSFYPQLIPLIAAFPFADSLVIDRKQGYLNQVLARVPFRKYLKAKAIINAIIGGLAAVLPLVLMYIISSSLTNTPLNHPSVDAMALRPYEGFFRDMYFNHPDGFIWMILGITFVIGATFASLGLGASLLINNRFIALGVPLILFNALQFFAERTRLIPDFLAPLRTLLARSDTVELITQVEEMPSLFILPLLVLLLSVLLFSVFGKRELILENLSVSKSAPRKQVVSLPSLRLSQFSLKPGNFLAKFALLAKRTLKPIYLFLIPVIVIATGTLFSKFLANAGHPVGIASTGVSDISPIINAWDVVFIALGNPYVMTLLFANLYLILISTLQPETGFGQIALFRLGSRRQNWAYQILFLFLTGIICSLCFIFGTYLAALLNGYSASSVWSLTTLKGGAWVNLPAWLPQEFSLLQTVALLWWLLSIGFFAMGLAVYTLNILTNKRLLGYLVIELFLLSSIGLTSFFMGKAKWLQSIPFIQNLLLSQIPYRTRTPGTLHYPFVFWAVLLAMMIPLSLFLYQKQDFPVKTDEE